MRTELHGLLATKHHLPLRHLPLFATACCLLTHLTVASLMSGQKTLDAPFFAKMGRLLALWRLRRASPTSAASGAVLVEEEVATVGLVHLHSCTSLTHGS